MEIAPVQPLNERVTQLLTWSRGSRVARWILGPLALAGVGVGLQATRFPAVRGIDFRAYRTGAEIGLRLGWQHIYDFAPQRAAIQPIFEAASKTNHGYWTPFVTPPPIAWVQAALAGLSFDAALLIWTLALAASLVGAAFLLSPRGRLPFVLTLAALLAVNAADIGLVAGNIVLAFPLVVGGAWRLSQRDHDLSAGLLLGLLALKPQTATLIPLALVASGRWKVLAGFTVAAASMAALSALSLGGYGIHQWIQLARWVGSFDLQSGLSVTHELGGGLVGLAVIAATAGCVAIAAFVRKGDGLGAVLPIGLAGSFLVAPYLNGEDFVLVAAAAVMLLQQPLTQRQRIMACILVLAGAAAFPHLMGTAALVMGLMLATLVWDDRAKLRSSAYRPLHLQLN